MAMRGRIWWPINISLLSSGRLTKSNSTNGTTIGTNSHARMDSQCPMDHYSNLSLSPMMSLHFTKMTTTGLCGLRRPAMLCPSYIFVLCTWSLTSFSCYMYYQPTFCPIPDFAAILILSSYAPLCNTSLIFLLCTDFPTYMFHSILTPLWLPSICYAHMPLSFNAIDLNSFVMCSLPCCASSDHFQQPTCTFTIPITCSFCNILECL